MKDKTEKLVTALGGKLQEKKLTLVTAESCTGGGLAYYISINPNASASLERGYVTYSNHSKQNLLSVQPGLLQIAGAVSRDVAIAMAKGALKNSTAQIAIATTGIAGPDRDFVANSKMQGIVWICCCSSVLAAIVIYQKTISGDREKFCEQVIQECLQQLIKYIKKIP